MPLGRHTLNSRTLNGPRAQLGTPQPAQVLLTLRQEISRDDDARALLTLDQIVAWRINPARKLLQLEQSVISTIDQPAAMLLQLKQQVMRHSPARQLLTLRQRVYDPTAPVKTKIPACRVYIGKLDMTGKTLLKGLTVTHGEGQASTASFSLKWQIDEPIDIPAFNGKSVEIEALTDPNDADSMPWRLFTGTVDIARYNRGIRGVDFTCTDLREERLGDEDRNDLLQLTKAVYSEITQREEATGADFVREMMRTVQGSLGYDRDGALQFYTWGIAAKPTDITLTNADVAAEDMDVDFQTRSNVINSVTVDMAYRYTALRTVKTEVEGKKSVRDWAKDGKGSFPKGSVIDRIEQGFSPWIATSYEFVENPTYDEARAAINPGSSSVIMVYKQNRQRCLGYTAKLDRYIVQPVSERYTLKVVAPQSVRAYRKEVEGSELQFSVDDEFDSATFEDRRVRYEPTTKTDVVYQHIRTTWPSGGNLVSNASSAAASYQAPTAGGGRVPVVDGKRAVFNAAQRAALLIAEKSIVESHRGNYVRSLTHRLLPARLGQVVDYNTRVVSTRGQITGITYTIGDGFRRTELKCQFSYLDDAGPVPIESWAVPVIPPLNVPNNNRLIAAPRDRSRTGSVNYDTETGSLTVTAPDVPEKYTDEGETAAEHRYDVALENTPITLINGW